jgi:AcrR family transcriptional regulator
MASAAPAPAPSAPQASTHERLLDAALASFGTRGYEATSLDALASELGVRKQTILYYHPSKADLLDAVIDRSAAELGSALVAAVQRPAEGFDRIEAIVRAVFRVAVRRPELLGLLREVGRLGPEPTTRLVGPLQSLIIEARAWLEEEMAAGRLRPSDPQMLLLSIYSAVMGVATEVEVLEALGAEHTLRSMVVRRRELLRFLRAALVPDDLAPAAPA